MSIHCPDLDIHAWLWGTSDRFLLSLGQDSLTSAHSGCGFLGILSVQSKGPELRNSSLGPALLGQLGTLALKVKHLTLAWIKAHVGTKAMNKLTKLLNKGQQEELSLIHI